MKFDVWTNTKELENNLKLQVLPSDLEEIVKEVVTDYWYFFVRMDYVSLSGDLNFIFKHITVQPYATDHPLPPHNLHPEFSTDFA